MRFADWGHVRVNYLIFSKWECLSISFQEQEMKQKDHTESPHGDARLGKTLGGFTYCTLASPSNFEIRVLASLGPHNTYTPTHFWRNYMLVYGVLGKTSKSRLEAEDSGSKARFFYASGWITTEPVMLTYIA